MHSPSPTKRINALGFAALMLAGLGCTQVAKDPVEATSGPPGAPIPTAMNQELVDQEGCRWWVVATSAGLEWERLPNFRADCDSQRTESLSDRLLGRGPDASTTVHEVPIPFDPSTIQADVSQTTTIQPEQQTIPAARPDPIVAEAPPQLYIQAATFRSLANAQTARQRVRDQGFPVFVPENDATSDLHKIIAGPFADKNARLDALRALKFSGFPDAHLSVF